MTDSVAMDTTEGLTSATILATEGRFCIKGIGVGMGVGVGVEIVVGVGMRVDVGSGIISEDVFTGMLVSLGVSLDTAFGMLC